MPDYRRFYVPGALIFITCVTYQRTSHFADPAHMDLLWQTLKDVQTIHPFHLLAYVFLPDHFHWVMQTPEQQPNFSEVMKSIKWNYSWNYRKVFSLTTKTPIWQERFWDHLVRNETDLQRHFDYIHWNPVKHGYVQEPEQWKDSSYRHWLDHGYYEAGWGWFSEPTSIKGMQTE